MQLELVLIIERQSLGDFVLSSVQSVFEDTTTKDKNDRLLGQVLAKIKESN
jgi:hypothetical protein